MQRSLRLPMREYRVCPVAVALINDEGEGGETHIESLNPNDHMIRVDARYVELVERALLRHRPRRAVEGDDQRRLDGLVVVGREVHVILARTARRCKRLPGVRFASPVVYDTAAAGVSAAGEEVVVAGGSSGGCRVRRESEGDKNRKKGEHDGE